MEVEERYECIIAHFEQNMPIAETELVYTNPYELIVAVSLSAQCTDKRVNMVTPFLFEKYPDVYSLFQASQEEIYELIKSISYPNNKAKNLVGLAKAVVNDFKGEIPAEIDNLVKLPGVGRKTANVIVSVIHNKPAMAVDTHVFRVSARIGLTHNAKNPLQAEKQLVAHIPEQLIPKAHHWLILHGRYVCKARKPMCENCGLQKCCKYFNENNAV